MRGLVTVLGLSCLLAVSFINDVKGQPSLDVSGLDGPSVLNPGPDGLHDGLGHGLGGRGGLLDGLGLGGPGGPLGGVGVDLSGVASLVKGNNSIQAQLGKEIANATIDLVRHTVTVIGIIVASVQQILDGICNVLFKLYNGFLYPILDCLWNILGVMSTICAISHQPCIYDLLLQVSQGNRSELCGIVEDVDPEPLGAPPPARRRRGVEPSTEAPATNVTQADPIGSFLAGFTGEDRKFAVLSVRFGALIIQVTIYLSVHLHLLPIIFCSELRNELGFNDGDSACRAVAGEGGKGEEGGKDGGEKEGGGLLGGLLGGK